MKDLQQLSQQELIQMVQEIQVTSAKKLAQKDTQISAMEEQLQWYQNQIQLQQKALYGRSSEKRSNEDQISLFDEAEVEASAIKVEPTVETVVYPRKKNHKKRKIDLSHLPVTRKVYELAVEEQVCPACDAPLRKIGEDIKKELVYHPARYEVIEHVQYVYACRRCEQEEMQATVVKAKAPAMVLPKSIASPSLLATIINDKYNKAIPLYRQEVSFKEQGLFLSRQTMANWMIKLYDSYFKKLLSYMHTCLLQMEYIYADETTVQVLKEVGKAASRKSYMWVYKSGRSEEKQLVIYQYEASRAHQHVQAYLAGYQGILQSDGYAAYDTIQGAKHMGCWAHARRKFVEALELLPKGSDVKKSQSHYFLDIIQQLFHLEKEREGKDYAEIYEQRQQQAKPLVEKYFQEIQEILPYSVKKSPLHTALQYSANQKEKLVTYLEDGRIEISNNSCERTVKPFTIGRKNWLFMNSVQGAASSGAIYSIMESAKANGLVAQRYMEYLLEKLPSLNLEDVAILESVLPWSKELPTSLYVTKKS